jgi:hypothetical protein
MITQTGQATRQFGSENGKVAVRQGVPPWLIWGAMIGLVQIFAIATVQPLGVSTAYPQLVGYLVDKIVPGFAESQPYLQKIGAKIGWEVMLIFGRVLGAFLSRMLSRREVCTAPSCGVDLPFRSSGVRALAAFAGGFLIIFGARLAGCPSPTLPVHGEGLDFAAIDRV